MDQKPSGFVWSGITTGVSFCNAIAKNQWVFATSVYKRNNAVSCCNTCSDSVLIKILCCLLSGPMNTQLKNQQKTLCFSGCLSCGSLSLGLYVQSDFHLSWNTFQ